MVKICFALQLGIFSVAELLDIIGLHVFCAGFRRGRGGEVGLVTMFPLRVAGGGEVFGGGKRAARGEVAPARFKGRGSRGVVVDG